MRLPEGLPELRGRWLAGYKVLWWAMFALALAGIAAMATVGFRSSIALDTSYYGVGLRVTPDENGIFVSPATESPITREIVPGSQVLAVDGREIEGGGEAAMRRAASALAGRDGMVRRITLRAPDGTISTRAIARSPGYLAELDRSQPLTYAQRQALYLALNLASSLALVVASLLLFRRQAGDPVVALLAFGMLALPAGGTMELFADEALRSGISLSFTIAALVGLMLSMSVFPAGRFTPRWTAWLIPALLVAIFINIAFKLSSVVGQVLLAVTLVAVLTALVQRFRQLEPGPQRQQIKWAVLGFAGMVFFGLLAMAIFEMRLRAEGTSTYLALAIAQSLALFLVYTSLAGGLVISLLRHRLYDADAAISRSALYGGLTVMLVAIFAGFEKLIETLGEEWYGGSVGAAAGAIAAALAALFLVPLHHRMSRWAEGRFQKDIAAMRAALPELLAELRDSENPRELADDALRLALAGVRARHGAIALADDDGLVLVDVRGLEGAAAESALATLPDSPEPGIDRTEDSVFPLRALATLPDSPEPGIDRTEDSVFPLRLPLLTPSGTLAGWLLLGPHPDGSLYGKDDREALEEIASPLARALSLALERARRADARRAETHALRETLDAVAERLAEIAERIAPAPLAPRKPRTVN